MSRPKSGRASSGRASSGRASLALRPPADGRDLSGFPAYDASAGSTWHRVHRGDAGPWWFGSDGSGRFDLDPPRGTCYLAATAATAVRERVGPQLVERGWVPASVLAGCVVSALVLPAGKRLANTCVAAALPYGVTREIDTVTPYDVTRAWARALRAAGCDGVRYRARFSPGADGVAIALFGRAGERRWPGDRAPRPATDVAERLGLRVLAPPHSGVVEIVEPPRRR